MQISYLRERSERVSALGGEFPTESRPDGEIPRTNGKPNSTSGSVVKGLLMGLPDEVLIEECARRGFKVEATDA